MSSNPNSNAAENVPQLCFCMLAFLRALRMVQAADCSNWLDRQNNFTGTNLDASILLFCKLRQQSRRFQLRVHFVHIEQRECRMQNSRKQAERQSARWH